MPSAPISTSAVAVPPSEKIAVAPFSAEVRSTRRLPYSIRTPASIATASSAR